MTEFLWTGESAFCGRCTHHVTDHRTPLASLLGFYEEPSCCNENCKCAGFIAYRIKEEIKSDLDDYPDQPYHDLPFKQR